MAFASAAPCAVSPAEPASGRRRSDRCDLLDLSLDKRVAARAAGEQGESAGTVPPLALRSASAAAGALPAAWGGAWGVAADHGAARMWRGPRPRPPAGRLSAGLGGGGRGAEPGQKSGEGAPDAAG